MAHTHSIDCFASFLSTFPDETFVCEVFYHRLKKKNQENIHCVIKNSEMGTPPMG